MRTTSGMTLTFGFLIAASSAATAQGPGGGRAGPSGSADAADLVARMMAFDSDKDGSLTKAEVTDERLLRLFNRADANKDGVVTKDELTGLAAKEHTEGGGPGGPGGGPGGPGGRGGPMMGFPRPGEVLPAMLQQRLRLTREQRTQLESLQKEVDERLAKILNDEQQKQLKDLRDRGPGRFGPPGGRGPGGPDGPPPGGGPPPDGPPPE